MKGREEVVQKEGGCVQRSCDKKELRDLQEGEKQSAGQRAWRSGPRERATTGGQSGNWGSGGWVGCVGDFDLYSDSNENY